MRLLISVLFVTATLTLVALGQEEQVSEKKSSTNFKQSEEMTKMMLTSPDFHPDGARSTKPQISKQINKQVEVKSGEVCDEMKPCSVTTENK